MQKKSKAVEILKGTRALTQADSTGSPITNPPRISPNPSILISTKYPSPEKGPGLRQFQRGLRSAQSGQDLEVRDRTGEAAIPSRLQDQPDLPLHEHRPREGRQRRLPHLRLPGPIPLTQIISLGYSAKRAFEPFKALTFRPFRDAGYAECSYKCTVSLGRRSFWTAWEGWSTPSDSGGSATRPSTSLSTSTTRRSRTETSIGSSPISLSPSARPPIRPLISTAYQHPHAESHLHPA
jgi:hypothetical protein